MFLLHKWDILKKIKSDLLQEKLNEFLKYQAIKLAMVLTKSQPILERIAKVFNKKKLERWYQERSIYVAFLTYRLMMKILKKKGETVRVRNRNSIRMYVNFFLSEDNFNSNNCLNLGILLFIMLH